MSRIDSKRNCQLTKVSALGRLGEVAISENEDYAKWSIDILCSFRKDEAVQKLTASRQSGGVSLRAFLSFRAVADRVYS